MNSTISGNEILKKKKTNLTNINTTSNNKIIKKDLNKTITSTTNVIFIYKKLNIF